MKKKAIALTLFLVSFLFVLGNGAKIGFCPCHHEFFLTECTCDQGCAEHGGPQEGGKAPALAHHHREDPTGGQEGGKASALAHHHREDPTGGQEGGKAPALAHHHREDPMGGQEGGKSPALAHHHREDPTGGQEGGKSPALAHHHREDPTGGQEGGKSPALVDAHQDGCDNLVTSFPVLVFEFGQATSLFSSASVAIVADTLSVAPDFCLLEQKLLLDGERAPPYWEQALYLGYMSPALL